MCPNHRTLPSQPTRRPPRPMPLQIGYLATSPFQLFRVRSAQGIPKPKPKDQNPAAQTKRLTSQPTPPSPGVIHALGPLPFHSAASPTPPRPRPIALPLRRLPESSTPFPSQPLSRVRLGPLPFHSAVSRSHPRPRPMPLQIGYLAPSPFQLLGVRRDYGYGPKMLLQQ